MQRETSNDSFLDYGSVYHQPIDREHPELIHQTIGRHHPPLCLPVLLLQLRYLFTGK